MAHPHHSRQTILLISPYWKEEHRWMVSSVKLAELWQRMGYRVEVLCMGEKTEVKHLSETLIVHTRKDFFLPDPWNYGIARGFSKHALNLARTLSPDLIIVNKVLFWSSFALLKLRKDGFKVLLLTDALVGMTWWPRGWLPRLGAFLYAHTLGTKIIRRASEVVFFHPQPTAVLKGLGIQHRSQVIPTGLDVSRFHSAPKDPHYPVVSYVGRLESVKGVDDFAFAAEALKRFLPHVTFQVVGFHAPDHPLVRRYKHVITFTGLRHDIADILAKTDIFVMPSYSEGLSNALMEAMASGCACVATRVGGNTFLLDHGKAGELFHPGKRSELVQSLRHLIVDPTARHHLGHAARKRIEEVFDWNVVEEKYAALFARFTQ